MPATRLRRSLPPVAVVVGAAAALALFRWAGTRWTHGATFDLSASLDGRSQATLPRVQEAATHLLDSISVASLLVAGGGVILLAFVRKRVDVASACALLLLGANVTTLLLKRDLASRTMAGVTTRSFPSGHATAAMSIALAAVLASPAVVRVPVALIGLGYATAVGISSLILGAHFPSDIAGGFCVATGWAAAAMVLLRPRAPGANGAHHAVLLVLLAVSGAGTVLLAWSRHPDLAQRVQLHVRVVEASVGIAAVALVCVGLLTVLLARDESRSRYASGGSA